MSSATQTFQDIIRSSSPLTIPQSSSFGRTNASFPTKPDVYFIGCGLITHTILDTLCSYGESAFPYHRIFLFDTRIATLLERSRISRWHFVPTATDNTGEQQEQVNHSLKPKTTTSASATTPTNSPHLTASKHTLAQLCKMEFQDRIPNVPISVVDTIQSELPPNISLIDKIIVYTDVGLANVTTQKRIEEQVVNPLQLFYLFQNGLFAIYQNGYVWKNRFSLAYHVTHSGMKLSKEGCDIYVDYLRLVKRYKEYIKEENIYDIPTRFYKYKLTAQCFPLGTILAMIFVSGQPNTTDYPYIFDYSSLYSNTIIDNTRGKEDTGLIFTREVQLILKEKVHWVQSFDKGSGVLYGDLLSYFEWTGNISENGKTQRLYLLCGDGDDVCNGLVTRYGKSVSVVKEVTDHNKQKGYTMRHADWIWRLDTTVDSGQSNREITQLIYDYYKPAVVLSDHGDAVSNAIIGDIVIPKKFTIPRSSDTDSISPRRMALKRLTLAFSFMNWVYLIQNPLYMEQFARSHRLNIDRERLEISAPEDAHEYTSSDDAKTQPYQFTEWFRWKAELHRDSCATLKELIDYVVDTYDIYPEEIYYEKQDVEHCLYKKSACDIDTNSRVMNTNILSWIKQRCTGSRTVIRSFDVYRFILVCRDEKGNHIIVPPLYYCAP